jgi:hypothetical protein
MAGNPAGQKLGCGGLIAILVVVGLIIAGVKKAAHSVGIGGKPATTAVAAAPTGTAHIVMMHGPNSDNSCTEEDGEARIYVTITLRNSGDAAGTVNPWATFDYSDGGNSTESYGSNWGHDFNVPAHSVRDASFYHTFNPQQHSMIRCAGYADLSSDTGGYYLPAGP